MNKDALAIPIPCQECGALYPVARFVDMSEPPPARCCHEALLAVASMLAVHAVTSTLLQARQANRDIGDAVADEMVTSENPDDRKAAVDWRNLRHKAGGK